MAEEGEYHFQNNVNIDGGQDCEEWRFYFQDNIQCGQNSKFDLYLYHEYLLDLEEDCKQAEEMQDNDKDPKPCSRNEGGDNIFVYWFEENPVDNNLVKFEYNWQCNTGCVEHEAVWYLTWDSRLGSSPENHVTVMPWCEHVAFKERTQEIHLDLCEMFPENFGVKWGSGYFDKASR